MDRSNRENTISYLYRSLTYYMFGDQPDPDLDREAYMTERDPRLAMAKKLEADVFARSSNKEEYLRVLREHVMKLKTYARSQAAPRGDNPAAVGVPGRGAVGHARGVQGRSMWLHPAPPRRWPRTRATYPRTNPPPRRCTATPAVASLTGPTRATLPRRWSPPGAPYRRATRRIRARTTLPRGCGRACRTARGSMRSTSSLRSWATQPPRRGRALLAGQLWNSGARPRACPLKQGLRPCLGVICPPCRRIPKGRCWGSRTATRNCLTSFWGQRPQRRARFRRSLPGRSRKRRRTTSSSSSSSTKPRRRSTSCTSTSITTSSPRRWPGRRLHTRTTSTSRHRR